MDPSHRGLARQLMIEALAGAAAAVAVAIVSRAAHTARCRHQAPGEREPDGSPGHLTGKLVEYALLRLGFRAVMQSVRFTGRRLLT